MSKTEQRLHEFILAELLEDPFHGSDPLAAGLVDSLGIEQLVEFIHESFEIELQDEDVVYDNFESLAALAGLIESRH